MQRTISQEIAKEPSYIRLPFNLVVDPNINPLDWLVYGVIKYLVDEEEEGASITNGVIANILYTTPTTVSNSLKRLEDFKYIKRHYRETYSKANRVGFTILM